MLETRVRKGIKRQGNTWCVVHDQVVVKCYTFNPGIKEDWLVAKTNAQKAYTEMVEKG